MNKANLIKMLQNLPTDAEVMIYNADSEQIEPVSACLLGRDEDDKPIIQLYSDLED